MKTYVIALVLLGVASINTFGQTEEYKATLRSMLEFSGHAASFKEGIKQILSMVKQNSPTIPEEVYNEFETEFTNTSIDDIINMMAPVYSKHLDQSDLEGIIQFYKTPAGKKYAEKLPLISQESMMVAQQWSMELSKKIQQKLSEKGY